MDEQQFDRWLKERLGFTDKSARDVRSRIKRASNYIDLNKKVTDAELLFSLTQHPEFGNLSVTVKSQLKRSVKLFREFNNVSN
ncbi:hypothetical protein [Cohnella panacarvi]|uniref:hypothetical protein n=1 Tax=Cohnella panacarvi TaxID=400776 RepID=UPI000479969D|nr:hypothetical protein [Cohnella panacarvi]